jgi:hypothetical protein
MEVEIIIAIVAVVISVVIVVLFTGSSKSNEVAQLNENSGNVVRKRIFALPAQQTDANRELENVSFCSRLGLTRDDGCVVTISFDIQVGQLY